MDWLKTKSDFIRQMQNVIRLVYWYLYLGLNPKLHKFTRCRVWQVPFNTREIILWVRTNRGAVFRLVFLACNNRNPICDGIRFVLFFSTVNFFLIGL